MSSVQMYPLKLSTIAACRSPNNYPSTFQLYPDTQQNALELNHFRIYSFNVILRYIKKFFLFFLCPFSFHFTSKVNQIKTVVSLGSLDESTLKYGIFYIDLATSLANTLLGNQSVQLHQLSCHSTHYAIHRYFAFLFLRSACLSANCLSRNERLFFPLTSLL